METFGVISPEKAREYFENKMTFTTGPVELSKKLKDKGSINIIDVRQAEDFEKGHIPGAVNLPEERWDTFAQLAKDKVNVLYCYSIVCHLAAKAAVQFSSAGYPVMELDGGFKSWQEHGLEVEGHDSGDFPHPPVDDFTAARMTSHH